MQSLSILWYNGPTGGINMQKTLGDIKAQLFGRFEVRKTVKQKAAFAKWACEYAQALGLDAKVERSGKWFETRNIVFGDLDKARILITAHYDTCARLPFGNWYTPECWPAIILTQLILPVAVYIALWMWLGLLTGTVVSAVLLLLMLFGPANPHTANDNTSGVAFVLLALHALQELAETDAGSVQSALAPLWKHIPPVSGNAMLTMQRFANIAAPLMDGGLPAACDWIIRLWLIPRTGHCKPDAIEQLRGMLSEYPMSAALLK